jgi:hypothetical protein
MDVLAKAWHRLGTPNGIDSSMSIFSTLLNEMHGIGPDHPVACPHMIRRSSALVVVPVSDLQHSRAVPH